MTKLRLKQAWLAQETQGLQGLVSGFDSASLQGLSHSLPLTQLIHELGATVTITPIPKTTTYEGKRQA